MGRADRCSWSCGAALPDSRTQKEHCCCSWESSEGQAWPSGSSVALKPESCRVRLVLELATDQAPVAEHGSVQRPSLKQRHVQSCTVRTCRKRFAPRTRETFAILGKRQKARSTCRSSVNPLSMHRGNLPSQCQLRCKCFSQHGKAPDTRCSGPRTRQPSREIASRSSVRAMHLHTVDDMSSLERRCYFHAGSRAFRNTAPNHAISFGL